MPAAERITEKQARTILRRMMANGPLTAPPKAPRDLAFLMALAAARFPGGEPLTEKQVNDRLRDWLGRFSSPYGIDHVTVRRCLVDSGLLERDKAGATYALAAGKVAERLEEAAARLDPAAVMAQVRAEREARKRAHAA